MPQRMIIHDNNSSKPKSRVLRIFLLSIAALLAVFLIRIGWSLEGLKSLAEKEVAALNLVAQEEDELTMLFKQRYTITMGMSLQPFPYFRRDRDLISRKIDEASIKVTRDSARAARLDEEMDSKAGFIQAFGLTPILRPEVRELLSERKRLLAREEERSAELRRSREIDQAFNLRFPSAH